MNKQEKIIVALLIVALIGSMQLNSRNAKRYREYMAQQQQAEALAAAQSAAQAVAPGASAEAQPGGAAVAAPGPEGLSIEASQTAAIEPPPAPALPERTFTLSNEVAVVTLTSKGGAVKGAKLLKYDLTRNPEDGVVELDFSAAPTLSLENLPGFGTSADFDVVVADDGRSAVLTAETSGGLVLNRSLAFEDGYRIAVSDTFENRSTNAVTLPASAIRLGPMRRLSVSGADTDLAIDAKVFENGKTDVVEIGKATKKNSFSAMYGLAGGGCRGAATVSPVAPAAVSAVTPGEIHWATVRERFFLQILTPSMPATGLSIEASRVVNAPGNRFQIESASTSLLQPEAVLQPGTDLRRDYALFVGPRKLSELRKISPDHVKIMRFGTWGFFCRLLLDLLNFLHSLIPNYGVAIILLTVLVRLALYPLNKKNAEGMRKMQEIQPLIKDVQTKFKDDPQKLQAETMRIYSEHKVNPLSSCLPMLIQLPIFIALFTVLRSSVELRYASFLWIADLSEPENLFKETLGFGVNLLPIAMAGTMALQTYLTPSAGDPSQQKTMMVVMPLMMLFMFYQFPSALGLYWTVSQLFAIIGVVRAKKARQRNDDGSGGGWVSEPPRETRQMRRDRLRNA
ncbi:MAG: YidC/Oxa1 family insertase periplasmic-domain containing protein [Kiritimatiellia bacterium]|jgi:YidC/Oxa1 family membrane protein insertase